MKLKVRRPQARRFGRAGESVPRGDRRKRELVFGRPFPPLTARPKQRREKIVGLTVGTSPRGGAPKAPKKHGEILTPVGHPFITHPTRRFAPITVRQDWNAVRQELEQVSDSVGIRESSPSQADIKVTRDLIRAGQILKIEVLDHIVMGSGNFSSLKSLGHFYA